MEEDPPDVYSRHDCHADSSSGPPESGYSTPEPAKPKKLKYGKLQKLLTRRKGNVYYGDCSPFAHDPPGHTAGLPCCERLDKESHVLETPHYPSACATPLPICQSNFSVTRGNRKLLHGRPMFSGGNFSLRAVKGAHSLVAQLGEDPDIDSSDPGRFSRTKNDKDPLSLEHYAIRQSADDLNADPHYSVVPSKGDTNNRLQFYGKGVPEANSVIKSVKSAITNERTRGDSGISCSSAAIPSDVDDSLARHHVLSYHVYAALPVDSSTDIDDSTNVSGVSNKLYDIINEYDLNMDMFSRTKNTADVEVPRNLTNLFTNNKLSPNTGACASNNAPSPSEKGATLGAPKAHLSPVKVKEKSSTTDDVTKSKLESKHRRRRDKKSSSDATNGEDSSLSDYEDFEPVIHPSASADGRNDNTISGVEIVHSPLQQSFSAERKDDELSLPPYPDYSDDESVDESFRFPVEIPPPEIIDVTAMGYKYPPRVQLVGAPSSVSLHEVRDKDPMRDDERTRHKSEGSRLSKYIAGYSYPQTSRAPPPPVNRAVKPAAWKTPRQAERDAQVVLQGETSDSSGDKPSSASPHSSDDHSYDNALTRIRSHSMPAVKLPGLAGTANTSLSDTSPDESDADLDHRFKRVIIDPQRRVRAARPSEISSKTHAKRPHVPNREPADRKMVQRSSATFPRTESNNDTPITLIL